jgi:hypothetical protein
MAKKKATKKPATKKKATKKKRAKAKPKAKPASVTNRGKKTVIEMLTRRAMVRQLIFTGRTVPDIAAMLNIDKRTITADVDEFNKAAKLRAKQDVEDQVAEQLARLDEVEAQAWAAWNSSRQPRKITEKRWSLIEGEKKGDEPKMVVTEMKERTEERDGDPRWLKQLTDIARIRAELLGLNRKEEEFSMVDDIPIVPLLVKTREEIEEVLTLQKLLEVNKPIIEAEFMRKGE